MTVNDVELGEIERPGLGQWLMAGLGLLGLTLVWILAVVPCALWLAFNLVFGGRSATRRRLPGRPAGP